MEWEKRIRKVNIDGEEVLLKKSKGIFSFLGWSVVHPIKVNGKLNWKNIIAGGSWTKLIITLIFIAIIIGAIFEHTNTLIIAKECLEKLNNLNNITGGIVN